MSCANTSTVPPSTQQEVAVTADLINRARGDISYLDGTESEGRSTASRGFTRAATYLAAQLRANGLQPVLDGEYRLQYAARIVRHREVDISWVARDTTRAVPGRDYLITGVPQPESTSNSESPLPDVAGLQWHADVDTEAVRWWQVNIQVDDQVSSAPMHVIGMIPGADPNAKGFGGGVDCADRWQWAPGLPVVDRRIGFGHSRSKRDDSRPTCSDFAAYVGRFSADHHCRLREWHPRRMSGCRYADQAPALGSNPDLFDRACSDGRRAIVHRG